jgi:iron complex transport system ATP-binding protein
MQNAQLLLLDEPTAFLDLKNQVACLSALVRRVKQGLAVVAVLHDVNLAAQFATHVALLKSGSLIRQGPVGEVLSSDILSDLYEVPFSLADGRWFCEKPEGLAL